MNCPKCGAPVQAGVRFCGKCGASMPAPAPAPAPVYRTPAQAPAQTPVYRAPAPVQTEFPRAKAKPVGAGALIFAIAVLITAFAVTLWGVFLAGERNEADPEPSSSQSERTDTKGAKKAGAGFILPAVRGE